LKTEYTKAKQQAWDLITRAKNLSAFTGAGVSTLSGLKDFRGKNGLYKEKDAARIFDLKYFRHDPSSYYENSKELIYETDHIKPSLVHKVLADLEANKILKDIITQNIDMLHQKAGSSNILEIHGTPVLHHCIKCGTGFNFETIKNC